ncbi:hypothetical protein HYZ82_00975 [Candidatus Nomurabacteria bacterium]|nr:hypothetical protein [Candidatus Nomurabacteria bacterium]
MKAKTVLRTGWIILFGSVGAAIGLRFLTLQSHEWLWLNWVLVGGVLSGFVVTCVGLNLDDREREKKLNPH